MRSRGVWVALGVAGIVVALGALGTWGAVAYTARPDFCAGCHLMQTRYVSWKRSPHSTAATCIQCHSEPGLIGEVKAHLNGTRYLWVILTGDKSGTILRAAVSSETCAQCHPSSRLPEAIAARRIDHARHLARDISCAQCHAGLVHGSLYGHQTRPAVETCGRCHASERPGPGRPGGAASPRPPQHGPSDDLGI
jgi:cytochrome c nitrite reductase small subunit